MAPGEHAGHYNPVVYWLEDRPRTVEPQLRILKDMGINHFMFDTPAELLAALNDAYGDKDLSQSRIAFLLDMMLFGVDAHIGSNINAGYIFAERILRAEKSRFLNNPICFLTEHFIDEDLKKDVSALAAKGGAPVQIVRKYSDNDRERFLAFLKQI
jgi:hypothetical protein